MIRQHTNSPQEKTCLYFDYRMEMEYEKVVQKEFFTIKALPCSDRRQQVLEVMPVILPETEFVYGHDGFQNRFLYGAVKEEHKSFQYRVEGRVEIGQILFEDMATEEEVFLFRHSYGLNTPGKELKKYFASVRSGLDENAYVSAVYLMRRLHQDYIYRKGITYVNTTAEEAWNTGGGVCQDYAHIYIALCHLAGIPARYVTGITLGEGESHAWVEILYRGKWIGMDPTNDSLVARSHIKFAHGRDASDCMINRGILYGGGIQTQKITVTVDEKMI